MRESRVNVTPRRPPSAKAGRSPAAGRASPAVPGESPRRPGWDLKGMMVDEKRKVSLLRGKLQEKHEELHHAHRQLREASESVADFEKTLSGLYARLETKEAECRELRSHQASSTEQVVRPPWTAPPPPTKFPRARLCRIDRLTR